MTKVSIYDPFADVFPTLFRSLFAEGGEPSQRAVQNGGNTQAVPMRVDVVEAEGAYTVKADLPGVPKDAIHVDIDGNRVTIRAEIKRESEQKDGERLLRSERYYGAVYRSFVLPVELDETNSQAKYENGVLELTLAKKPAVAGRKLTIQ